MNQSKPNCLDRVALQQFLEEQLTAADEQVTQEHLANCHDCQEQLDKLVTKDLSWHDLQENLRDLPQDTSEIVSDETVDPESFDLTNLLASTDDPESLGRLGRHEISGMIGRGSAGIVFKGHDATLNRYVAIKMLTPGLLNMGAARKRFEREARAIASVNHPNVIEVHGVDEFRKHPYIVMQYCPDGSLQNRIDREGWMTTKEVCRIGMQIASGLAEAHRQGIIHRDIKPANILLEKGTERAIVSDFGLASVADEVTMTLSGTISGTPQFMSPEQARGQSLDVRSDLFSLGCVMYAACTCRSPFEGKTLMGVVNKVCESDPKPIRDINPEIAPWLAEFISKLLSKKPEDRFQTAEEIKNLLTSELAYLQMANGMNQPKRDWINSTKSHTSVRTWIGLGLAATTLLFAATMYGIFGFPSSKGADVSSVNEYRIVPTTQEMVRSEASAAYELAYQAHLEELELRGDMAKSIQAHQKALDLGSNPPRTSYLLGCAFAFERKPEKAFEWLDKACNAGFHDFETATSQNELKRLSLDPRYEAFLERVKALDEKYKEADNEYFVEMNFERAEQLYRAWLKECPQDEQAIMMLGASLLEQGKFDEAEVWNEKTRHSVRFANFGVYNLGCIAAQRGDFDTAFDYLYYSADIGFTDADHLENDHQLIPLREDSRFSELLSKMQSKDPV